MCKLDRLEAALDRGDRQRANLVIDEARHRCRISRGPDMAALNTPGDKVLQVAAIAAESLFRIRAFASLKDPI